MESISQNLGIKKDAKNPGRNPDYPEGDRGITPKGKAQGFFSQKNEGFRKRAY